ncbi:HEAT repeat domain-containing protein, partial [candidate division FCPU426 bacterium]|nr:HEAT repeat domain-containing protein [candidate division FCPU426 bacterium]
MQESESTSNPTPASTPWQRTEQDDRKEDFYQRYFRKGKEVKKEEDLPVNDAEREMLLKKILPQNTPTPEGDAQAVEIKQLIHELGEEHHRRQAAVERLAMIGMPAVPSLRLALQDKYKFKRIGALQVLGYVQAEEALEDIRHLLDDSESIVRGECVKVLGRMKHRGSAVLIVGRLQDSDLRVRREAVVALG